MGETADETQRAVRSGEGRRETRIVVLLSILVMAAITLGAGLGYLLAWDADAQHEASRRGALTAAINELRAAGTNLDELSPQHLTILGQAAGIADLRVEPPAKGADDNVRSVTDENGRIVGWLEWDKQNPVRDFMDRLAPFLALAALGALGLGSFAFRQMRRRAASTDDIDNSRPSQIDWLTALPNQYGMRQLVNVALDARQPNEIIAYGFADIDKFEEVNHSLGWGQGDQVLVEFASRLKEAFAPGVVARLEGDCFVFFVSVPDVETAQGIAEAACRIVARPYRIAPGVQLSAGIGFALAPRDGVTRSDLARRAQMALRAAKRKGRGAVVSFSPDLEVDLEEKSFIKRDLARALTDHALAVHYQPIVTSDGGSILGVEALLRWKHPVRGNIPPALFVPIAEESGLMDRVGQFVLRRALADAADWPGLFVSVNLSPLQVRDPAFVGIVSSLLTEAHFEPSRLVLEVTEGVLISDPNETKARLEELRALGVRLALDDFGSGYSSLSYLQRLPFDKLKVDRGFVAGLASSANGAVIIQAVVALGRALGMSVLVEGVETEEQRILLRLAGCDEMQGYLFSRPVPREQIDQLLAGTHEPGRLRSSA